jgi:hypothetical protein
MQSIDFLLFTLNQITPLNPNEELLFRKYFRPLTLKKNAYFLESTNVNYHLGFLCKGLVRYFVFKNNE